MLTITVFCCALDQQGLPRDTDSAGCIFIMLPLMRELTAVISPGRLRGLMSIFTASKTEVYDFQQKPVNVFCKLFTKWCLSCSLVSDGVFREGLLLVKYGIHPNFNGALLFT